MFYNTVGKIAKVLHEFQKNSLGIFKKGITSDLLITLIDLSNELKKKFAMERVNINENSKIFRFRK